MYLEVKFAENPYLDYDKVLKDFTDHYYGEKAAVYIRQYLAALEDAAKKGNARITWYPVLSAFSYINAECMISFNRILYSIQTLPVSGVRKRLPVPFG